VSTPDPRRAARLELARALGGFALAPLRLSSFALRRRAILNGVRGDLAGDAPPLEVPELPRLPSRPLRLFLSCGETSSETHAVRLVAHCQRLATGAGAPAPELVGLGGEELAAAGVETVADPTRGATMGGEGVTGQIGFWLGVLERAAQVFATRPPDLFVPVDAPALHLPLARLAGRYGVPTLHFVAPQYWAWAPWRVGAYRRAVERALCILPFERSWFERHGVSVAYVGHPQLDTLAEVGPAPGEADREGVVLLPGSRSSEIETMLPFMLLACARANLGGVPVSVAQRTDEHAERIERLIQAAGGGVTLVVGDLHGSLGRARAALATSGTVLLDLLHHRLPAVVLYGLRGALRTRLAPYLVTVPHFASTNLLAGEEVLPERTLHAGASRAAPEVGSLLEQCYNDAPWRERCLRGLDRAAERLGPPGAAERAAKHVLALAAERAPR